MSDSLFEQYLAKNLKEYKPYNEEDIEDYDKPKTRSDFKQEAGIKDELDDDLEEPNEDLEEPDDDLDEPDKDLKLDIRKTTILSWLKKLNAKFKPYAKFKLLSEEDENGKEDEYLSLFPAESKPDRHFFHLSMAEELTKETLKEIVGLANKQLSAKASVSEAVNIRAANGWTKVRNCKAFLEYEKKDGSFNVEVFQETDNYKVSIYNIKKKKLEEVKKIHKNDIELKATVLNFMNQKN